MATATIQQPPQTNVLAIQKPIPAQAPAPLKVGVFGPQGSGKSTSAALIAAAISAQYCSRAPVFVVDPEDAWPFLERRIFAVEGVKMIRRPYRSFKSMAASIKEAEREGCCAWIADPLTLHWSELLESFKGRKGFIAIDQWGDIRQVWNAYICDFLNTKMTCIAAGRLGNDFEEQEEETQNGGTKTKLVKIGTKFKAGGGESFGYEPHLLLEMSLERKSKKVRGQEREGEGRMVHRVDVLKDRTWALNGVTGRWPDRPKYEKGDFRHTWNFLQPHYREVQAVGGNQIAVGSDTSAGLIAGDSGESEYYRDKQRRDACSREVTELLDHLFGGTSQDAKHVRREVTRQIFGVISKETAGELSKDKLERGLHILQAFEKRCKADGSILGSGELNILAQLDIDIRQYDEGKAEELELPF
jgi:hypothetical protein